MKRIFSVLITALTLIFAVGCEEPENQGPDTEYGPVTGLEEFEVYKLTTALGTDYVVANFLYEMRIYKDIDKVSIFNSKNHSNVSIYVKENYVDNTETLKAKSGSKYKYYKMEFDIVTYNEEDGAEKSRSHYVVDIDMNPDAYFDADGRPYYNRTVTIDGKVIEKVMMSETTSLMEK